MLKKNEASKEKSPSFSVSSHSLSKEIEFQKSLDAISEGAYQQVNIWLAVYLNQCDCIIIFGIGKMRLCQAEHSAICVPSMKPQ